jgi:hypothetical protein
MSRPGAVSKRLFEEIGHADAREGVHDDAWGSRLPTVKQLDAANDLSM